MVSKIFQRVFLQRFAPHRRNFSDLIVGNYSTKLDSNTLTSRILLYFDPKVSEQVKSLKSDEEMQVLYHIKKGTNCNLHVKSTEDIKKMFLLTSDSDCINSKIDLLNVFKKLDSECCSRLRTLKTKEILDILRLYIKIVPTKATQFTFYEIATNKLSESLETLTKSELLQLIFFVGQQKKNSKSQSILRKCIRLMNEQFIKELTAEEMCIICNSTFKTSTRINNKMFLDSVKAFINNNLYILKDPAIFISLVKTVRQNQCPDDNLLSTITCAIFFNRTLQYYDFTAMCHILALYADYMYYDENILMHFSIKCIDALKNSELIHRKAHFTEQIRDKDIKRFLWSLSRLGHHLDANTIRTIVIPKIIERIQKGALKDDVHSMVDLVLYLWMMNYQAIELLPYILLQNTINNIYESHLTKRLNILLTAIYFENRPVFRDYNMKMQRSSTFDKEEQIRKRPILTRIFSNLKVILPKTELSKFEFSCQIPYLEIVGIIGFKKNIYKAMNIEILDEFTSLRNTESRPSGLMQMKLRILDGFEEGLIVVSFLISFSVIPFLMSL